MKIDLYRAYKAEYIAPRKPALVETTPAQYLTISGTGAPGGEEFQAAIAALYKVAFTIKMASKRAGRDYAVAKLEAFWADGTHWRLAIRTPDFIGQKDLRAASEKLEANRVKLEKLEEGRVLQVLHTGPYEGIRKAVEEMAGFASENRMRPRGELHEIYLSDPRRVAPEKLRTILRQPVR